MTYFGFAFLYDMHIACLLCFCVSLFVCGWFVPSLFLVCRLFVFCFLFLLFIRWFCLLCVYTVLDVDAHQDCRALRA